MRLSRDALGGLLFIAFGLATVAMAQGYELGTVTRMGPGFFPAILGGLMALLGGILAVRELVISSTADGLPRIQLRPVLFVLGGVIAFAFLVESAGLIAAVVALVVLSRIGAPGMRPVEMTVLVAVLCALAAGIFVYGLGVPLTLGPA